MDDHTRPTTPATPARRLLAALLALWAGFYLFMASHEAGHVLAALLTGGRIADIELSPIALSHTHLAHNPRPLIVVWAGPVFGVADALGAWGLLVWLRKRGDALPEEAAFVFLAGLCLIANGVYIGLGWIDRVGDTGDMMRLGTPTPVMIGFGLVATALGLMLWHTLGKAMGLSKLDRHNADRLIAWSSAVLAIGFALSFLLP
ncbi:MAG: M50 family metallopeptidase [Phycisphaeraceae bacterium]